MIGNEINSKVVTGIWSWLHNWETFNYFVADTIVTYPNCLLCYKLFADRYLT